MTSRRGPGFEAPAAPMSHCSADTLPTRRPKREVPAPPRIDAFETVARECARRVRPRGEEPADAMVRTLAQAARRADIDSDAALAAVVVAVLDDPARGRELRELQVEIIAGWFRFGWADA